jgi:hypothetical protein
MPARPGLGCACSPHREFCLVGRSSLDQGGQRRTENTRLPEGNQLSARTGCPAQESGAIISFNGSYDRRTQSDSER